MTPEEYGLKTASKPRRKDPRTRRGKRRGLRRRAGSGGGWPHHSTQGLLGRDSAHLPQIRCAPPCRRSDLRLRPDGPMVRFGHVRHRARHDQHGEGLSSGYQPLAAVGLGKRVGDVVFNADEEWSHGFTYSGHPVACAWPSQILSSSRRKSSSKQVGQPAAIFGRSSPNWPIIHLLARRGASGCMGAIELVKDKKTRAKFESARDAGTHCRNRRFRTGW